MKTTLEISDDLFRQAKARAALDGRSLKDLVTDALRDYLQAPALRSEPSWRKVFGKSSPEVVAEVDAAVAREFGQVDPADWQ